MECFWLLDLYLLISLFTTTQASDSSGFKTIYRKTISDIKFPIIIKVPVSSDLIFVKCPGNNYVHDNEKDTFNSDTSRQFTPIYISTDSDKVRLHVINLKNIEKYGNEITCGMLHLVSENKTIRWSYKLEFTSIVEVFNKSTPFYDFGKIDKKCGNYSYKTVNYYKISDEMILEGLPQTDEIIKDTIIYSLPLIGLEENEEIIVPCKILRATNKKPTIELKNYKNISIVDSKKTLYYVKKVFGKSIQYTPLLIVPSDIDVLKFYSKEKISICQVKYVGENIYKNGDKKSLKDTTFSINSYGIYEISYFCDICIEGKNIETRKMFFFGPEEDTEIYEETYNTYPKHLLTKYPSCSLNLFSFAYLLKMSFNDENIYIKNLTKSKNTSGFVVKSDYILYNKKRNPNGILICTYQGPGRRFIIKNIYNHIDIKLYGINKINKSIYLNKSMNNDLYQQYGKSGFSFMLYNAKLPESLTESKSTTSFYIKLIIGILCFIILIVIPSILLILYFNKDKFKSYINFYKMKKRYPNIYLWWSLLSESNLAEYSMVISDESYMISSKSSNEISSFDNLYHKIIYLPAARKLYIWADGPSEDKINDFWKTIYDKDVVVVLGISYHGKRKEDYNVMNYCPQRRGTNKFGTISVEFLQYYNPRSPQTIGFIFQMTNEEGKLKYVTILHFSGWQIHKFPEYIHHTLNPLYEEIKGLTNKRYDCVLLHTSYGPDSRIFTFTFFSLMIEIMEGMDGTDEPMDIIDDVRKIINECYISSLEYILIQSSLVEYFYNKRILYGIASRIRFVEKYKMYLYNVFSSEKDMNFEVKEFLWFCRIMDLGKLRNICRQFTRIGAFSPQKLTMKCKRFYKIINMPDKCDKIRDKSMPCLDALSVDCYNGLSDTTDYDTFINANSLTYRISYDEKQTIILCQAPTLGTLNGVVDMVFTQKISVLAYFSMTNGQYKHIYDYFPIGNSNNKYGDYTVSWKSDQFNVDTGIFYRYLDICNLSNKNISTKIIQYDNWKDKNVPDDLQNFLIFYKEVIGSGNGNSILIMCENGVVKSGVLALSIYMNNTIRPLCSFNPIRDLAFLRKHRYGAINTVQQFVFVLGVLIEYHKSSIEKMCEQTYCDCMDTIKKYLEDN